MTATWSGLARFEFAALHIVHAGALVQSASGEVAFHHLQVHMTLVPLGEGREHHAEQRMPDSALPGAGMHHQIANECAGPTVGDGNNPQGIFEHETQLPIALRIMVEGVEPLTEIQHPTAALCLAQHQQLVNGLGIRGAEV